MHSKYKTTLLGDTKLILPLVEPVGGYVDLFGETFYKIQNYDAMPSFFMSIVSGADHWLFVASTGGLRAGRVDAEHALFPYYTEDKLTENSENTGVKTILRITRGAQTYLWEPFSIRQDGQYQVERHLYKNIPGTTLIFEEINHSLGLVLRYSWRTGDRFGFIKTTWLSNIVNDTSPCDVEVLDGFQNILPANISSQTQNVFSCLLDAYKRSELDEETNLGLYALNSRLTDLAEPSESLAANVVSQVGLEPQHVLLSSKQLAHFRFGGDLETETEVRGERGAYFVHAKLHLEKDQTAKWYLIADVNLDHAGLELLRDFLFESMDTKQQAIERDIQLNASTLTSYVSNADGLHISEKIHASAHHFSNVLFNVMRGGIFVQNYRIEKADLLDYLSTHQREIAVSHADFFTALPESFDLSQLHTLAAALDDTDLIRLLSTYLPLIFSRRHGDPSRPWNVFSINLKKADGSQRLDYAGNWRDIFQNWEALVYSYPQFTESTVDNFLCATTADGYNPYRISRAGIDWEVPEEGNPWANIGYWSDHQIIYLLKLMEASERFHPSALRQRLNTPALSYANVPYRIKPYEELLKDPHNTIVFDHELQKSIKELTDHYGSDGRLLFGVDGNVVHASLAEKLLTLLLAKLVNFVPEGGIWMNTQRPEWNDANNALVGYGLSVVTLGYLRRFVTFFQSLIKDQTNEISLHSEVAGLLRNIGVVLQNFHSNLDEEFTPESRLEMMNYLGKAGSDYRLGIYESGFSGSFSQISIEELSDFLVRTKEYIDHSLRANRRADMLYHSYNLLRLEAGAAHVDRLVEMLEGQVSILSSGLLSAEESLSVLESLRRSSLYRADQHTYILYPDRVLPPFLVKNKLRPEELSHLNLPFQLVEDKEPSLFTQDVRGFFHFASNLRNIKDVRKVLNTLKNQPEYAALVEQEGDAVQDLFERTFRHAEFTGRSGTFFAYEGLGSVYWHMISKLLLAAQETAVRFREEPVVEKLCDFYRDIRAGLGYQKTPAEYGAFPADPYSHTPKGRGARQPGMTGMVKEEILTRQLEIGLRFQEGRIVFDPFLLDPSELISSPSDVTYLDVFSQQQRLFLPAGTLTSFICQTPVVVQFGDRDQVEIHYADHTSRILTGLQVDAKTSQHIFWRDGVVKHLVVTFLRR